MRSPIRGRARDELRGATAAEEHSGLMTVQIKVELGFHGCLRSLRAVSEPVGAATAEATAKTDGKPQMARPRRVHRKPAVAVLIEPLDEVRRRARSTALIPIALSKRLLRAGRWILRVQTNWRRVRTFQGSQRGSKLVRSRAVDVMTTGGASRRVCSAQTRRASTSTWQHPIWTATVNGNTIAGGSTRRPASGLITSLLNRPSTSRRRTSRRCARPSR